LTGEARACPEPCPELVEGLPKDEGDNPFALSPSKEGKGLLNVIALKIEG